MGGGGRAGSVATDTTSPVPAVGTGTGETVAAIGAAEAASIAASASGWTRRRGVDEHVTGRPRLAQFVEELPGVEPRTALDRVDRAVHHIISAKRSARRMKNAVPK